MLPQASTLGKQIAGADKEQSFGACERRLQRLRVVEIGSADVDAALGEVGQEFGRSRGGDYRAGLGLKQQLDDPAAEMAGGAGHEQGFGGIGHDESRLRGGWEA